MKDNDGPTGHPDGSSFSGRANRTSAGGPGSGAAGGPPVGVSGAAGRGRGHRGFRLLAVLTVIVGVVALAAAAFVLSYAGVHDIARAVGLRAGLARFYPALPDALLVVACAAALALRNARWWARWFAWLIILLLVALVGTADALHAMAIKLPRRPTAAAVAILPWVLLLLGLQLWLSVLRHTRLDTPSSALPPSAGVPPPAAPPASAAPLPAGPAGASSGLDLILPPYRGEPGDGNADFAADLAVDAEPEPDDPAADDDTAFDMADSADGGCHDFAATVSPGDTGDTGEPGRSEEAEYGRPLLGAPVPEQKRGEPDQPSGETAPPKTVPPETVPPETVPQEPAPPNAGQPSQPSSAADFRRVRSSPLPPGEQED